jgi:hypothetical protein
MQKQKESHLKRQSMESMIPMSSANATLPTTSSVSVQFVADPRKASSMALLKFGTTADQFKTCFNFVGHILTVLLNTKLDHKFYDILNQLKPIINTDHYMSKFNFDTSLALKHNTDLSAIVRMWIKDIRYRKSKSEAALESVSKTEEFIKMIDKQENNVSLFVRKAIEKIEQKNQNHNNIESIIDEPTLTDQYSNVE